MSSEKCNTTVSSQEILKVLYGFNHWWVGGLVNPVFLKEFKRTPYFKAAKDLDHKSVVLSGTRKVGKSTILYQLIDDLLRSTLSPDRVLYLSMDHPVLKAAGLQKVLECYHENIYPQQDGFYFIDEIQWEDQWVKGLKSLTDIRPLSRFVAATSSSNHFSSNLSGGLSQLALGAGRWSNVLVTPLSFYEYCRLLKVIDFELPQDLRPSSLAKMAYPDQVKTLQQLEAVQVHLPKYLESGGFPHIALLGNQSVGQKIIEDDIVKTILRQDIPHLYKIRNSHDLERLFIYLCSANTNVVSIASIARNFTNLSRTALRTYLQHLEMPGLIQISRPIFIQGQLGTSSKPKVYVNQALVSSVLMDPNPNMNLQQMDKILRAVLYNHLHSLFHKKSTAIGHYRDIDVAIELPGQGPALFQLSYRQSSVVTSFNTLIKCPNPATRFVLTRHMDTCAYRSHKTGDRYCSNGIFIKGDQLQYMAIPLSYFLYLIGHMDAFDQDFDGGL